MTNVLQDRNYPALLLHQTLPSLPWIQFEKQQMYVISQFDPHNSALHLSFYQRSRNFFVPTAIKILIAGRNRVGTSSVPRDSPIIFVSRARKAFPNSRSRTPERRPKMYTPFQWKLTSSVRSTYLES